MRPRLLSTTLLAAVFLFAAGESVRAFCGFYVAQSGENLVNHASKVVLAHSGDRTSITMSSDIGGDPKEFALVVPVPTVIKRDQVRLVQSQTVNHLEQFSVPRLVEYPDPDPCPPPEDLRRRAYPVSPMTTQSTPGPAPAIGSVRVEESYSVGEYDIQVLAADNGGGLLTWLNQNGYKVPRAAEPTIASYIRQNMHFFVARVNLARQQRRPATGADNFLRPINVEYSSPKFMLPIRLGTVNAEGPQDMIVLALTARGRVETTNYRTVRMPTGAELPLFVKSDFARFYKAAFDRQVADAEGKAVFLEYAWDMSSCDPCSAQPLDREELRELGASWNARQQGSFQQESTFVTRLHVRYDRDHFPEDLMLQETGDRDNYQARYIVREPWKGPAACQAGRKYLASLPARAATQARSVLELTDWSYEDVRLRMQATGQPLKQP